MDVHTLIIVNAFLFIFFTIVLSINTLANPGSRGHQWFTSSYLVRAVGLLMIALYGQVVDLYIVLLGNVIVVWAILLLHRSFVEFLNLKVRQGLWVAYACIPPSAGLACIYFMWPRLNEAAIFYIYSLMLGLQGAMCAYLLFRHSRGGLRISGWLTGAILALYSISHLMVVGMRWSSVSNPNSTLDHNVFVLWLMASILTNGGVAFGFMLMTSARLRQSLEEQARTDVLTGVLNRRALETEAEREFSRSRRLREPLSVVMLDLDGLKEANDSLGHLAGDAVLRAVSKCLENTVRLPDRIARVGGDEFLVLLSRTSHEGALELAERLRAAIENLRVHYEGRDLRVSASFGVASLKGQEDSWEAMVGRSDLRLYRAKQEGRNRVGGSVPGDAGVLQP